VVYRLYDSLSHLFVFYRHVCFTVFMAAHRLYGSLSSLSVANHVRSREIRRESREMSCRSLFTKKLPIIGLFCEEPLIVRALSRDSRRITLSCDL